MATTTSLHVGYRGIDALRIRVADSGGTNGPTLLLASPWPGSGSRATPGWERAVSRPIPELAPVTTATWPSKS